ncbi:hypothetical protein [Candidatus Magnetaquicoccus inordinatus]|uniref:hypothetical protein n=1 Tax=Candidatus Magnetaquicoccus inordinatus TaxID=2496818 RepID=UPI00102BE2A3|nr:hypothetical protein [Candidatus Magnetaquicoccus inordinatus]
MSYWNLLVVVCFGVLYMGLVVIFSQLRRMRNEMKEFQNTLQTMQADPNADHRAYAEMIRRQLAIIEVQLGIQTRMVGERLQGELQAIQREMRFMSRPGHDTPGHNPLHAAESRSRENTYREAQLLLSNGVNEERVISETGLTEEEVRLLKRIPRQNNDSYRRQDNHYSNDYHHLDVE